MNVPVVMPQLGLTMTEGTVSEWLKQPGDRIKKDDLLFIVSTDKVDMEVESMVDGALEQIIVPPGQTVPVGTVLAYVQRTGPATSSLEPAQVLATPPPGPEQEASVKKILETEIARPEARSETQARKLQASPRAKRLAGRLGVDLATIKGSGPGGRIVEEDVRAGAVVTQPRPADSTHR